MAKSTFIASDNFTRPDNTTQYESGDLVANNATAASVVALEFTVGPSNGGTGRVRKAKVSFDDTTITDASFRLHLYASDPTSTEPTNGDNGAFATIEAGYLDSIDVTVDRAGSDAAWGFGVPEHGSEIIFDIEDQLVIYGLLEARDTYTPTAEEVFTVTLYGLRGTT